MSRFLIRVTQADIDEASGVDRCPIQRTLCRYLDAAPERIGVGYGDIELDGMKIGAVSRPAADQAFAWDMRDEFKPGRYYVSVDEEHLIRPYPVSPPQREQEGA